MGLTTTVRHDLAADVAVMRVEGELNLGTAPAMRAALLTCVADCPSAIVVDVAQCLPENPAALSVFPSVARHEAAQPTVAVLVCGVTSDFLRNGGSAALGPIRTYRSRAEALLAAAEVRASQLRMRLRIQPSRAAPGLARDAIDSVCDQWHLDGMRTSALLIISELVANAVLHGAGEIDVEAVIRGDFLNLRVHDGSPLPPTPAPPPDQPAVREYGRGLQIVAMYSTAWGYVIDPKGTGKVVWATLRVGPIDADAT